MNNIHDVELEAVDGSDDFVLLVFKVGDRVGFTSLPMTVDEFGNGQIVHIAVPQFTIKYDDVNLWSTPDLSTRQSIREFIAGDVVNIMLTGQQIGDYIWVWIPEFGHGWINVWCVEGITPSLTIE